MLWILQFLNCPWNKFKFPCIFIAVFSNQKKKKISGLEDPYHNFLLTLYLSAYELSHKSPLNTNESSEMGK